LLQSTPNPAKPEAITSKNQIKKARHFTIL
jgi:hypothetical protein